MGNRIEFRISGYCFQCIRNGQLPRIRRKLAAVGPSTKSEDRKPSNSMCTSLPSISNAQPIRLQHLFGNCSRCSILGEEGPCDVSTGFSRNLLRVLAPLLEVVYALDFEKSAKKGGYLANLFPKKRNKCPFFPPFRLKNRYFRLLDWNLAALKRSKPSQRFPINTLCNHYQTSTNS